MRYALLLLLCLGCAPSPLKEHAVSSPWIITEVRAPDPPPKVIPTKDPNDILELVKIEHTPKLPAPQERVELQQSTPPAPSFQQPQRTYQRRGIFRRRGA